MNNAGNSWLSYILIISILFCILSFIYSQTVLVRWKWIQSVFERRGTLLIIRKENASHMNAYTYIWHPQSSSRIYKVTYRRSKFPTLMCNLEMNRFLTWWPLPPVFDVYVVAKSTFFFNSYTVQTGHCYLSKKDRKTETLYAVMDVTVLKTSMHIMEGWRGQNCYFKYNSPRKYWVLVYSGKLNSNLPIPFRHSCLGPNSGTNQLIPHTRQKQPYEMYYFLF